MSGVLKLVCCYLSILSSTHVSVLHAAAIHSAFLCASDAADNATEVVQDKLQSITSRWAIPQLSSRSVPYLLATSDLLFGLATGMTLKFFPIFFLKQVGLAPVATNFVMAATPLAVAAVAAGSPQLASLIGEASLHA